MTEPHRCVILAIDPGAKAGWSIWIAGKLATWGACEPGEEIGIVQAARAFEAGERLPLVIVAERWTAGGWRSHASLIGLGAAWGRWDGALRMAGHPKRRVLRVYPQTWRARVIAPKKRGVTSEEWRHLSARLAGHLAGEIVADHNVADAICIGRWAIEAFDVGELLPRRKGG